MDYDDNFDILGVSSHGDLKSEARSSAKDAKLAVPSVKYTQLDEIVQLVLKQLEQVCAPVAKQRQECQAPRATTAEQTSKHETKPEMVQRGLSNCILFGPQSGFQVVLFF